MRLRRLRYWVLLAPITYDSFNIIPLKNPSRRCALDSNLYNDAIKIEFLEWHSLHRLTASALGLI